MAGSITDLLDRVSDSATGRPVISTLASPGKAVAAPSITISDATNWTTTTAIHFSIYKTTTVGSTVVKDPTTQTDWKGTLSGTTVSNLTLTGGTDRVYNVGDIVELTPTSRWAKDLYDHIATEHKVTGGHSNITTDSIQNNGGYVQTTGGFTTPLNSIQPQSIAANVIFLGYAQLTSNFSTTSTTQTQVTGLTVNVTVPAGGRKVKVMAGVSLMYNQTANKYSTMRVWNGTVGTGTAVASASCFTVVGSTGSGQVAAAVLTLSAGAYTFNVGFNTDVGGAASVIEAGASAPAYLLVEYI